MPPTSFPTVASGLSRRTLLRAGAGLAVAVAAPTVVGRQSALAANNLATGGRLVPALLNSVPFTVAHRGGSLNWAPMSKLAYDNSAKAGVSALEISLARTSDGKWFGLHDQYLDTVAVKADGSAITGNGATLLPSAMTWAQVSAYRIAQPVGGSGGRQPFMLLDDLLAAYSATHSIFFDTKYVPYSRAPELVAKLTAAIAKDPRTTKPSDHYILKAYCTSTDWARDPWMMGLQRWGYFYASEQTRLPVKSPTGTKTLLETYQSYWTSIGLDLGATKNGATSAALWSATRALYGKTMMAHILSTSTQVSQATSQGAKGVMIADPKTLLA